MLQNGKRRYTVEDTAIIELFWKRDETAIQELKSKYTGYCYKIAWNLLENHEDTEECLNDTWLAAWRYMPPKRPSVLSAFVGKITRGLAIDCFRKKCAAKRADTHIQDVCGEMDELNFSYTVDEKIAEKELVKAIANRHGVSEGCIKTNLCRNRKKLYRILKKEAMV